MLSDSELFSVSLLLVLQTCTGVVQMHNKISSLFSIFTDFASLDNSFDNIWLYIQACASVCFAISFSEVFLECAAALTQGKGSFFH